MRALALALAAAALVAASAAPSVAACAKKGFASPPCSACDLAADFVRDASIIADCRACCVADAAASDAPPAAAAVLELCSTRLRAFPHTETFVKKHVPTYGGRVTVRQRYGWPPRLVLLDGAGRPVGAPVAIDQWKTEAIAEYLAGRGLVAK